MYWTIHLKGAPSRVNHSAVAIDDKIYSFGGYSSEEGMPQTIDVYCFDTASLTWSQITYTGRSRAPKGIYGHSVVAHKRKIYLWGGQNGYFSTNWLYCFDIDTSDWKHIETSGHDPKGADGHSACVINDYMYIFGGFEVDNERFRRETYRIHLGNFIWQLVETEDEPPCNRDFHTASAIGDRMYIFGGRSYYNNDEFGLEFYCNEMKYLDTKTMNWVTPICSGIAPCGRRSHSACVYNNEIYIIAGYQGGAQKHLNDVHKFNPVKNEWIKLKPLGIPPVPRRRHCSVVIGDQLFLFGGSSPKPYNKLHNCPNHGISESAIGHNNKQKLFEHGDLHVLDFSPSLKRFAQLKVLENKYRFDLNDLPISLKDELQSMMCEEEQKEPLNFVIRKVPLTHHPSCSNGCC